MIDKKFNSLALEVKKFLEDESSGHDFYHAERVYNNAVFLHQKEGGDLSVIAASALVHDVCRPWEKKTGKQHFSEEALEIIKEILKKSFFDKDKIPSVLEVVKFHDIYDWTNKMQNKSIELQIIQDADNLDAIGAIGIGRTFAFGGANNLQMYIPGESLNFTKDFVDDPNNRKTTIAHFYEKLLKLKENMNTKTGKKLAEQRHKVMEDFLEQFFNEWEGRFE